MPKQLYEFRACKLLHVLESGSSSSQKGNFMPIQNNAELAETVERVSKDLQAIQKFLGRDLSRPCKIRFPYGYIRTASHFRNRFWFVSDTTLRQNIGYTLILNDVLHWLMVRTSLTGTAKEMLIKDGIVLLGNIAESLTKLPLSSSAAQKPYKKRTERLETMGIITTALRTDLDWLWDTRNNCHLFLVTFREYGHYTEVDYNKAFRTTRALRDALDAHFR
jgi:hypothetical protein